MLLRALCVITLMGWVIYLTYTMTAALTGAPQLPEAPRAAVLAMLIAGTLALIVQRAARRIADLATGRYRDGYADGYVDGVTDRRPAPERTLRAVPSPAGQ